MKCTECHDRIEKGYDYAGDIFCHSCLIEHINDDLELRANAIEEWIELNCKEVRAMKLKEKQK